MERQERPGRVMHVGQMGIERGPERALAEGEIVEHALGCSGGGDTLRLVGVDAARHTLVRRQLDADDEIRPAGGADRRHHLAHEAGAPLEAAAMAVRPVVAGGREELRDQIAMGAVQLDPAEARALQPLCAPGIARDDARNLVFGEGSSGVPVKHLRLR